jgi:sec-independent protein translocase protein TatB
MFDVGFSEILVIAGLSLVVLGPNKLPGVARKVGHWAGRARAMARQFRDQLEAEADAIKAPGTPSSPPPPPAAPAAGPPGDPPADPSPAESPPPPPEFTGAPMPAPAAPAIAPEPPPHG